MDDIALLLYVLIVPPLLLALWTNRLDESQKYKNQHDWLLVKTTFTYFVLALGIGLFSEKYYPVVNRDFSSFSAPSNWTWCAAVLALIVLAFSIRLFKKWEEPVAQKWVMIILVSFMTFWGTITGLGLVNELFDRSSTRNFFVSVVDKKVSGGKGSTYFLVVQDWKNSTQTIRLKVTRFHYSVQRVGTKVEIITKPGLLGHEWIVDAKRASN